jgi:hypothetical protein
MGISAQNLAVICIVINMRAGESERLEIIKASRAMGEEGRGYLRIRWYQDKVKGNMLDLGE